METKTSTSTPVMLPVMKYYNDATKTGKDLIQGWKKGEKPIASLLGLFLIGVGGWAAVKFIIIPALAILSQVVAAILSVLAVGLAFMLLPTIYKLFRRIVRSLQKRLIRWKPFEELEDQRIKMWESFQLFLSRKAKIKELRNDFEQMGQETQKAADTAKEAVQSETRKAGKYKEQMDAMIAQDGEAAKETDAYVEIQQKYISAISAGSRMNATMDKNIEWTTKYAVRSNVFANLDRKLAIGATLLENKIKDFEESIMIMKKEYEMASASRGATAILNQILGPDGQNWELDYALEFIQGRISEDLAMTAQNLEDLERNTTAFNFDSDEAYEKLIAISQKIDAGGVITPDAKKISNPNHKLTSEEKKSAGRFGNIFN